MGNNVESLIRAIVPLSFMAIWALTWLFNRDSKPKPPVGRPISRSDGTRVGLPPRPVDPTLRFGPATAGSSSGAAGGRRPSVRVVDDEGIVILSSETNRIEREREKRFPASKSSPNAKRATRGKPILPQRSAEAPSPTRTRLAGVNQNVNQHLANTNLELTPLSALPPVAALGLTGSTPAAAGVVQSSPQLENGSQARLRLGLGDAGQIRQAFILNEILQPPVSMRTRKVGSTPR